MGPDGLPSPIAHRSRFAFIRDFLRHLRSLPPGDAFLATILGGIFILSVLAGLYGLQRQFLVEVPSRGGSLLEGVVGTPRFANPLLALSDEDRDLLALTHAGLMGYLPDGTLIPVLAERYDVSEDGTVYTFVLRKNARFSDGRALTASDVVFTVEKAQDPGLKSPELANWANIRVEAIDARTVRFTLPAPYVPFLSDATLGILPAHHYRDLSNEEFPFSPLSQDPVGAGPFTVTHITRDGDGAITRYELSAREDFVLGRPYLDRITLVYFPTEEALNKALEEGRIESAYGIPFFDADTTLLRVPYARVFGVFWNAASNPLYAREDVRKALSIAIDRDALIRDVLGGYARPAYGPVPPGSIDAPVTELYDNRIEEAATILERNGWAYDSEERLWKHEKDALSLTISLATGNVPELKAVAEALRDMYERLGVPVELSLYESNELATTLIRPRTFDALLFGMAVSRAHDLFAFWDSSGRQDPGLNIAQYANRAVDVLLEDIREEQDPAARKEMLARLDALIAKEYPVAFTHAPEFLYSLPRSMGGVTLTEVSAPSDRFSGVWEWYRRTEHVWPVFAQPWKQE